MPYIPTMAGFIHDIRFAGRLLVKERAFATTALVTLAICIGANTAIFSIVRSVVLRPLPVPHAERIVIFHNNYPNAGALRGSTGVPDYFDRRAQMDGFEELALYRREGATIGSTEGARRLATVRATPSFYRLVSAHPQLGRIFTEEEGILGKEREAILSDALWHREFGGRREVIGQTVDLSGNRYEIVGVMPPSFKFLWSDIDLYLPAAFTPRELSDESRHSNNWTMIGMLQPGVTLQHAQDQVKQINILNDTRFPQFTKILHDAGFYTGIAFLQEEFIEDVRPVLYLLWGGVLFVLLIGCLNLANLVMLRASGRSRELATRHAIGAPIGRLARQLLTETTLLAVAGGLIGLFLGWWALRLVPALGLDEMPRGHEIGFDPSSAFVILALSIAVGIAIGLTPVARLWRFDTNAALREEGRGGTVGRRTNLVRRILATAQVTVAFVLLIGAALLFASFRAVLRINPGFQPSDVVTGNVGLPDTSYKTEALTPFIERMLSSIRALPGVQAAGVSTTIPMSGDHSDSVILAEGYQMKEGESLVSPNQLVVSPGYFEAMRIPLLRGRYFDERDTPTSPATVIVDERVAAHFWPGQDPLGRRMYLPTSAQDLFKVGPDTKWLTVVGVVKTVEYDGLTARSNVGAYYFPYPQSPERFLGIVVRTAGNTETTATEVRKAITALDARLPFYGVHTMQDLLDQSLVSRRVPMLLASAFAFVALFLAAIGIYGVLAYGVAQRRREIGIRLALGGSTADVFGLVLRDGVKIVVAGLVFGAAGLMAVRQLLQKVLYGVQATDPLTLSLVAAGLIAVALVATVIPARRASKVNPAEVLLE